MRRVVTFCIGLLLLPSALPAQSDPTIAGPPLLPNYERVPVGEREALEAGAYLARTSDPNANWYNPAGLALAERTGANLSASAYEATTIELASLKRENTSLRFSPLGAFFGMAIGQPLTSSSNLRYGFYIARPIAWQTGTLDIAAPLDAQTTFSVNSEATLTRMEPGVAIGVKANEHLRIGGALGVSITSLDVNQGLAVRHAETDSAYTARRTLTVAGSAWHVVPRVGLQWDGGAWRAGLVAAAPGIAVTGSARVSWSEGSYSSEDRYYDASFHDDKADFAYEIPFTAGAGIAWTYSRGSIEGTVRYYGASDEYDLLTSGETARVVDGAGVPPPAILAADVAALRNSWAPVTNFALGGNYKLSDALRLHFGVNSDGSPVENPDRSSFRKVNLFGGTAGVSYQGTTFGASLGLGYSSGSSDPIAQFGTLASTSVETRLKVSTFRAMYSFSARF